MPSPDRGPAAPGCRSGEALALGALHGPAELLPISSSGHVALIPWLLGWRYVELDDELRKSFEVALHAGTAAALLITLRGEVGDAVRGLNAAAAGADRAVVRPAGDRRLRARAPDRAPARHAARRSPPGCSPARCVMAWADRAPAGTPTTSRPGAADALWLGVAQACALIPGVSRNGATLAAARLRRFTREDANRLSRHVALPVIAGATLLKGDPPAPPRSAAGYGGAVRRRRRGVVRLHARLDLADPPGRARPLAAALRGLPDRAWR